MCVFAKSHNLDHLGVCCLYGRCLCDQPTDASAHSCLTSDPSFPASSCDQEQQSAQEEARQHKNDAVFVPDCAQGGLYKPVQCHPSTGYCWCVLVDTGRPIPGTSTRWERPHLWYFRPHLQTFLEFIARFFVTNKPDSRYKKQVSDH